jgi:sulfatase maturation enzyme AslB (radical SAM superfamily)
MKGSAVVQEIAPFDDSSANRASPLSSLVPGRGQAAWPCVHLDCTYCYYRHKEEWLPGTNARIADDLLEEFIRQYITGQEEEPVVFNWHGGEPTLLGLDFFRKVVQLEEKYAAGKRIENDFQTNGVLLDESWCELLKQNRFGSTAITRRASSSSVKPITKSSA